MTSFTTLNKFDAQGHPIKYDNYPTEVEAQERIVELHAMGLTDAFYVDDDATTMNGHLCFDRPKHWVADSAKKTILLDQVSMDAEDREINFGELRVERDKLLSESDKNVLPDRWHAMDAAAQDRHTIYRQDLRDLPATVTDPAKPIWPTKLDTQRTKP